MSDWAGTLAALLRERGAALFGYAHVLTGSATEAEDLLRAATTRTFRTGRGSRGLDSAQSEVRRAIAVAVMDRARRSPGDTAPINTAPVPRSRRERATPDLQAALLMLPAAERVCVVLHYLEELPVASVATEAQLSEGAVVRHLADGIERLHALHVDLDFTEHFTISVADGRAR